MKFNDNTTETLIKDNRALCTIVTSEYLSLVLALDDSLVEHGKKNELLFVLIAELRSKRNEGLLKRAGVEYIFVDDICQSGYGKKIFDKYFHSNRNAFRWSIKPVLINYLIEVKSFDKVIFLDSDLYFYGNYEFLFDMLDKSDVLLTPHWRSFDPNVDKVNFELQSTGGIFNGGFVGVNKRATYAMEWWAMVGESICEINPAKSHYGVQTHLNLMPIIFDRIEIVKHRGCNVANWNRLECARVLRPDGEVWINDVHPIIFIHFTGSTISGIVTKEDDLLLPHLLKYNKSLQENGWPIDIIDQAKQKLLQNRNKNNSSLRKLKKIVRKWLR